VKNDKSGIELPGEHQRMIKRLIGVFGKIAGKQYLVYRLHGGTLPVKINDSFP
jgi:hypothetical protein